MRRFAAVESSIRFLRRCLLLLLLIGAFPGTASPAPVLMLDRDGTVRAENDPYLVLPADRPPALTAASARHTARISSARTMYNQLASLLHHHQISNAAYRHYKASWSTAIRTAGQLGGTRRSELQAVIDNLHGIAATGYVTRSRLAALFLTLDRNRDWWTRGRLLSSGDRVEFTGSEEVFEYYPGQGLEIQELGSFGKASGLYDARNYNRMRHLLSEMIPLASLRRGNLTWEYYFYFDGGSPPWTSAMSQAAAIEALTRASHAFPRQSRYYLRLAGRSLSIYHRRPGVGVTVPAAHGSWYLLYSFAPGARVLNGFLWSLVGLFDYAHASGSKDASRLFAAGDREARAALPRYDTGSWSLYEPGQLASLDYHKLVIEFLHNLCDRTHARVYCQTASRFESYLKHPPPGV